MSGDGERFVRSARFPLSPLMGRLDAGSASASTSLRIRLYAMLRSVPYTTSPNFAASARDATFSHS